MQQRGHDVNQGKVVGPWAQYLENSAATRQCAQPCRRNRTMLAPAPGALGRGGPGSTATTVIAAAVPEPLRNALSATKRSVPQQVSRADTVLRQACAA